MTTSDVGQASEFLSALFEGASDGLCLVAPDDTVLRANQNWLRSTGLFAEQVIGADIIELFPESRDLARELYAQARQGERVLVPEHRQVILGRETWWDGTLCPVPMEGGVGLLITAREVSHLRGAPGSDAEREEQGLLRLVIEHSPSPMALFDRELRYLAASPSWVRYSGHGSDCIGRRPYDLVSDLPDRYLDMYRRCLAGAVEAAEEDQVVRADGTTTWFSYQCRPWRTARGEVGGLLVQAEILNTRKEAEAALRRAEEEMDRARLLGLGSRINEIELVVRLDGTIVHVNDRAVAAYGYARDELEGLDVRRLRQGDPPALVAGQLAQAAHEGIRFEAVHLRKDGTRFPVEVSSRAFEVAGERYLHSLVRDLTEQRRAEAALRESEGRLARVLEASRDGFFDLDLSTGVSTRSDRVAGMLGREPQAIPPTLEGFFALVHREDLPAFQGEVASVLAGERPLVERDIRAGHADGSWRWLRVRARLTGPAGARRFSGTVTDVTEEREARARAEALAREQEILLQTANVGISRVVDRRQVWANRRMAEMLGYSMEEQVGQLTRMLYPTEEAYQAFGRAAYPVLAAGQAYQSEQELVRKDGTHLWARYCGMAVDPRDMSKGTIWVLEDVTAQVRAREGLRESEERLRSIISAMAEGVVFQDATGRIVTCNGAAERILGLTRAQLEGLTSVDPRWRAIQEDGSPFPGESHPAMVTLRTGQAQSGVIMGVEAPGAELHWISVSSEPLRLAPGQPPYAVVATFADVTELRRGQELLRAREAMLDRVLTGSTDGFIEWDPATGHVERNPRTLELAGLAPGATAPTVQTLFDLIHPEDAASTRASLDDLVAGRVEAVSREHRVRHTDGSWRWLQLRMKRRETPTGSGHFVCSGTLTDVTQRREAQERLVTELQRNEALVKELQAALQQVKTLSGLLPICMHCHQIRDDAGYWSALETYFLKHSEVMFSHSLCPACARKHYPEPGED